MIINPKELRIGNHAYPVFVSDVESENCCDPIPLKLIAVNDIDKHASYRPIPLTEKRILKYGFEETDKVNYTRDGVVIFRLRDEFFFEWHGLGNGSINLKYVHQLQNLYFTLTQKELTIS